MSNLFVTKGSINGAPDSTFLCMSETVMQKEPMYSLVEQCESTGKVLYRSTTSNAKLVEKECSNTKYKGVYVDDRTEGVLPLNAPSHCIPFDMATFRRAKSDGEKDEIAKLFRATSQLLNKDVDEKSFRGAASSNGHSSAYDITENEHFVQHRGGFQDAHGRCTDMTRVYGKTPEWQERVERAYRGMRMVSNAVEAGASVEKLNEIFINELDSDKDVAYGNVVQQSGWQGDSTTFAGVKTLEAHDVVQIGCAVGDKDGNTALFLPNIKIL